MSRENVEIVRRFWIAWEKGDLETIFAHYDPAIVWVNHGGPAEFRGAYLGHDGVRRVWGEWLESFKDFENHAETFIDAGENVIVSWRMSGRGKASEVPVDQSGWSVHTIRNGLLIRIDVFDTKAEAFEAVGLVEPDADAGLTNLDLVRSIFEAWGRGDYSSAEWAHPEIEYVIADGPSPGSWKGLAGMAEAWRDFLSAWDEARAKAEDYRELDDHRVLVLFRRSGRGKTSGVELEQMQSKGANVFYIQGGKVTRLVIYHDCERGLADLGLPSEAHSAG
jgi:ketosteroid isomerase-like protein